jgi:hypothetical protein
VEKRKKLFTLPGIEPMAVEPVTKHFTDCCCKFKDSAFFDAVLYGFRMNLTIRRGVDKSLAFPISYLQHNQKKFFLDGLKKLEQRSHKCVALRGEYLQ